MDALTMLKVMALGLGTVFTVLFLLILVIGLINKVLNRKKKDRGTVKAAGPVEETEAQAPVEEQDDSLVAAIMAAVYACLHTSTHNFRVRSIRERRTRWGRHEY
jgi:sodium pump decarboxylase gamma subunit